MAFYECDREHNQVDMSKDVDDVQSDASNFAACLLELTMRLAQCSHMSVDVLDSIVATLHEDAEKMQHEDVVLPSGPLDPSIPVSLHNIMMRASKQRMMKSREVSRSIHMHRAERKTLLIMMAYADSVRRLKREALLEEMRTQERDHQQYMGAFNAIRDKGDEVHPKVRFTAMPHADDNSNSHYGTTIALVAACSLFAAALAALFLFSSAASPSQPGLGGLRTVASLLLSVPLLSSLASRLLAATHGSSSGPGISREQAFRAQVKELESLRRQVAEQREDARKRHAAEERVNLLQAQVKRMQSSLNSKDGEIETQQKKIQRLQQEAHVRAAEQSQLRQSLHAHEERERELRRSLDDRERRLHASQQLQMRTDQLLREERQRTEQLRAEVEHADMSIQDLGNEASVAGLRSRLFKLEAALHKTRTLLLEAEVIARVKAASRALQVHETDRGVCKVCMDQGVSLAIVPCGHVCVCTECAAPLTLCPICRIAIKAKQPVFFA